ncbi:toxin-antitoxin system YwqK family antitoxin [Bacteroidota bacterium]
MKTLKILSILFLSIYFISCKSNTKYEKVVINKFPNGVPRMVNYLKTPGDSTSIVRELRYFDNGEIEMEGGIKDGYRDGEWKSYRKGGLLWSIMNYSKGYREGINENWRDNGNRNFVGYYSKDKAHGLWQFFSYETGKLIKEITYENGEIIKEENFDE